MTSYGSLRLRWWIRVSPLRRTSQSTAQPVAWSPPLCRRTRLHYSSHHLPSSTHPFFLASSVFPWRTFTISPLLQPGIRLLCRLRPLSRMLAFSHPFRVKRFESSLISYRKVKATRSCLLYAGRTMEWCSLESGANEPAAMPFWLGGNSRFPPFDLTTLTQISLRQHRLQG